MTAEIEIHNIYFEQGSVVIGYIELPDDVRAEGRLIRQHQLRLSLANPDYADDAEKLHRSVVRVLRNALEDFTASEPYDPSEDDGDDDEDRGMGE